MIIVQAKAIPKDETSKNKIIEAAANLIDILKAHLQTEHFNQFGADINGLLKEDLDINVFSAENVEL